MQGSRLSHKLTAKFIAYKVQGSRLSQKLTAKFYLYNMQNSRFSSKLMAVLQVKLNSGQSYCPRRVLAQRPKPEEAP